MVYSTEYACSLTRGRGPNHHTGSCPALVPGRGKALIIVPALPTVESPLVGRGHRCLSVRVS